jgi:septal ring factor EnvC (AmiA/AmiB activator)
LRQLKSGRLSDDGRFIFLYAFTVVTCHNHANTSASVARKELTEMNEREVYQQKSQSQLDEWKAEFEKLKVKASTASADAQAKLNDQINDLEGKIAEAESKLAELNDAADDAWESIKEGFEEARDSLESAIASSDSSQ